MAEVTSCNGFVSGAGLWLSSGARTAVVLGEDCGVSLVLVPSRGELVGVFPALTLTPSVFSSSCCLETANVFKREGSPAFNFCDCSRERSEPDKACCPVTGATFVFVVVRTSSVPFSSGSGLENFFFLFGFLGLMSLSFSSKLVIPRWSIVRLMVCCLSTSL